MAGQGSCWLVWRALKAAGMRWGSLWDGGGSADGDQDGQCGADGCVEGLGCGKSPRDLRLGGRTTGGPGHQKGQPGHKCRLASPGTIQNKSFLQTSFLIGDQADHSAAEFYLNSEDLSLLTLIGPARWDPFQHIGCNYKAAESAMPQCLLPQTVHCGILDPHSNRLLLKCSWQGQHGSKLEHPLGSLAHILRQRSIQASGRRHCPEPALSCSGNHHLCHQRTLLELSIAGSW